MSHLRLAHTHRVHALRKRAWRRVCHSVRRQALSVRPGTNSPCSPDIAGALAAVASAAPLLRATTVSATRFLFNGSLEKEEDREGGKMAVNGTESQRRLLIGGLSDEEDPVLAEGPSSAARRGVSGGHEPLGECGHRRGVAHRGASRCAHSWSDSVTRRVACDAAGCRHVAFGDCSPRDRQISCSCEFLAASHRLPFLKHCENGAEDAALVTQALLGPM